MLSTASGNLLIFGARASGLAPGGVHIFLGKEGRAMLNKINELSIKAYIKANMAKRRAAQAGKEFLGDERGLSGVVVAVLLILVAVLAVVLLWGNLSKWLDDMWKKITSTASGGGLGP